MGIATINPATGETLKTFDALSPAEIDAKIALAESAFREYRQISFVQRSQWLKAAADILERDALQLGKLMTLEMGKPIKSAIAEISKCAWVCRYYADNASAFLQDIAIATDASRSFVKFQPLGIILAVMPWNFPFWQVFRFAAPALMAGNVGLLKHASNVPQAALAIEAILREAGFPEGTFQTLLIGASQVESVIADPRVKAATLTGSEPAGASLASSAGKHLKKTVLELGGSDPFIILKSADLDAAIKTGVMARMLNNGQTCIAAKRFIVHEAIADRVQAQMVAAFGALKVGDPMLEETDLGPLATPTILQDLDRQVQASLAKGATALIGGKRESDRPGNFYPPTILTDITPDCPAYYEEFFGPVALFFRVSSLDEAITLANATSFGLGASAWTKDSQEQERLIEEIEAGSVFINGMVKSDPRLPFGGTKRSGYGRELGLYGLQEFLNIKTIWIQ
jgi:succinate-semialdehyde dehydrogenase/glutarate-semialdehyde dehydrogenase